MRRPITYVDAYISNVNNISKTYLVFDDYFEMFPKNPIQPRSG